MRSEIGKIVRYRCDVCARALERTELVGEGDRSAEPLAALELSHGGRVVLSSCGVCARCASTLTLSAILAAAHQGPDREATARRWLETAEGAWES